METRPIVPPSSGSQSLHTKVHLLPELSPASKCSPEQRICHYCSHLIVKHNQTLTHAPNGARSDVGTPRLMIVNIIFPSTNIPSPNVLPFPEQCLVPQTRSWRHYAGFYVIGLLVDSEIYLSTRNGMFINKTLSTETVYQQDVINRDPLSTSLIVGKQG
jgi:hypothetical protein